MLQYIESYTFIQWNMAICMSCLESILHISPTSIKKWIHSSLRPGPAKIHLQYLPRETGHSNYFRKSTTHCQIIDLVNIHHSSYPDSAQVRKASVRYPHCNDT